MMPKGQKGFVYFVKFLDYYKCLYKIGCTKNLEGRLIGLRNRYGNLELLASFSSDHPEDDEYIIHEKFYRYSHHKALMNIINNMRHSPKDIFIYRFLGYGSNSVEFYYLKPKRVINVLEEFSKHQPTNNPSFL